MRSRSLFALALAAALTMTSSTLFAQTTLSHGLFSGVQVFRAAGGTPRQFVFLVSNNDTPSSAEQGLIDTMVNAGAMVAAVPLAPFYRRLEAQDGKCTYAGGAFENLARQVQAINKVPGYLLPTIVGAGGSAPYAYAVLAQAPSGTFASALSVGFCPRVVLKTPPCAVNALRWQAAADGGIDLQPATALTTAWTATPPGPEAACTPSAAQAFVQQVPQASWAPASQPFAASYAALVARQAGSLALGPAPAHLAGLPVIEEPVRGPGPRFAVLLSGDGGWAGIDKGIAAAFVAKGVPVVGFDSLRYFWTARTPESLASDLDRIIRYYADRWKRSEVILIGYSQGADVLPFALNRLPAATRSRVHLSALLGVGQKASFEFHLSNWMGPSGDKPIAPEARKLSAANTICVYGQDERDSLCPELAPVNARAIALSGGHHFGGDYDALAARILDALPK